MKNIKSEREIRQEKEQRNNEIVKCKNKIEEIVVKLKSLELTIGQHFKTLKEVKSRYEIELSKEERYLDDAVESLEHKLLTQIQSERSLIDKMKRELNDKKKELLIHEIRLAELEEQNATHDMTLEEKAKHQVQELQAKIAMARLHRREIRASMDIYLRKELEARVNYRIGSESSSDNELLEFKEQEDFAKKMWLRWSKEETKICKTIDSLHEKMYGKTSEAKINGQIAEMKFEIDLAEKRQEDIQKFCNKYLKKEMIAKVEHHINEESASPSELIELKKQGMFASIMQNEWQNEKNMISETIKNLRVNFSNLKKQKKFLRVENSVAQSKSQFSGNHYEPGLRGTVYSAINEDVRKNRNLSQAKTQEAMFKTKQLYGKNEEKKQEASLERDHSSKKQPLSVDKEI